MGKHRDVSGILRMLRDFLLGRKQQPHNRYPDLISPRTIPPADIPRGPEYKYSNQWYFQRSAMNSVKPPVVAPIAEGPRPDRNLYTKAVPGGMRPEDVCFNTAPTPGPPWWWDGHCYYECLPCPPATCPSTPPTPPCPPKPTLGPSSNDYPPPPCPRSPDAGSRH